MKKILILGALSCVCLLAVAEKAPDASPARFTAKVVDEDGKPLAGMSIVAKFYSEEPRQKGFTDSNGLFVAQCSRAMLAEAGYSVNHDHSKSDYYESGARYDFKKIANGRWQPWDPVVTAIVRRVVNPIPMYAKKVETRIPTTNIPCGYDLMVGDWLSPYGRGSQPDFTFTMEGFNNGMTNYESHLTLQLSNCVDGIQRLPSDQSRSVFMLCRNAPESGYGHTWTNTVGYLPGKGFFETQGGTFADPKDRRWGYAFRIRSVTNEQGEIVEAWYGKIHGPIVFFNCTERVLHFTYYLNPMSNDRNLEFDPKRNLFKNLKSTEQVTAP